MRSQVDSIYAEEEGEGKERRRKAGSEHAGDKTRRKRQSHTNSSCSDLALLPSLPPLLWGELSMSMSSKEEAEGNDRWDVHVHTAWGGCDFQVKDICQFATVARVRGE